MESVYAQLRRLNPVIEGEPIEPVDYAHQDRGFAGDCVHATQTHFVDRYLAGVPFEPSGPDYLRSLRVQEAVYASAEKNEVVEPDRFES